MRNSILAFAALMMVAGCGDNGTVKLDGGHKGDMAVKPKPTGDMAMAQAVACGAIYDCLAMGGSATKCTTGKPKAAVQALQDWFTCQQTACGSGDADGGATLACNQPGDAGAAECNTCINNTLIGASVTFQGEPSACVPTNATECGACKTQTDACFLQCFTDADCQGFQQPLTCQNGKCM